MKRYGNLFEQISSFENLFLASRAARKGKRDKVGCATFEMNLEEELLKLKEELTARTYQPGGYREFSIYERKPRKISAAPYRDRVVHHALCRVIEPLFEPTFIHDSYACRRGKGTHAAVNRFSEFANQFSYVLKTDIRKYFPSIDHELLYDKIVRKIKCPGTLWLVRLIIDGSNLQDEVNNHFPGDTLLTPLERRRGIPIGNLTSQFFANIYLDGLDHFVKEILYCTGYIRYVDDITIFGNDKNDLWRIHGQIAVYLHRDRLCLHPDKTWVLPLREGIDHLGYRIFPSHLKLRKDTSQRFLGKIMRSVGKAAPADIDLSINSWLGHARHAAAGGLVRQVVQLQMQKFLSACLR